MTPQANLKCIHVYQEGLLEVRVPGALVRVVFRVWNACSVVWGPEWTLLVSPFLMRSERGEADMVEVVLPVVGVNDIIQVSGSVGVVGSHDNVHQPLEDHRCSMEPKGKDPILPVPRVGAKGHL